MQHAGPGPAFVDTVRAGPQEEGLLQGVQGAVHGVRRGKGPEVVALQGVGTAVLAQLGGRVFPPDDNLRKALVVPEQHIEAWLHLLDQVDLEQEGVGLGPGGHELHGPGQVDHQGDALGMEPALGILQDPLFQGAGLADIEDLVPFPDHPVDPRRIGQAPDLVADQVGPGKGRTFDLGWGFGVRGHVSGIVDSRPSGDPGGGSTGQVGGRRLLSASR